MPVAALVAGPVFRGARAGTRSEAVAGSVLIAGGLTGLVLLPGGRTRDPPPIFTADLRHAETPAKEAIASLVLDAPLPALTKLDLAGQLGSRLVADRGRAPDLRPAFNLALADTRTLDPRAPAALKAGLRDAVDRLDREGRLPKVSQLLPEARTDGDESPRRGI